MINHSAEWCAFQFSIQTFCFSFEKYNFLTVYTMSEEITEQSNLFLPFERCQTQEKFRLQCAQARKLQLDIEVTWSFKKGERHQFCVVASQNYGENSDLALSAGSFSMFPPQGTVSNSRKDVRFTIPETVSQLQYICLLPSRALQRKTQVDVFKKRRTPEWNL